MGMIGNAPYQGLIAAGNLAPGAVVGHLGYTPVNKAGDTMTGTLNKSISTLGATAGDQQIFDQISLSDGSNADSLYAMAVRAAAGNNWTTVGLRLQAKVDSSWMGYVEFNGQNNGGVNIGAGISTLGPNGTGIVKGMQINSAGHVLKPYQPRFSIAGSGGSYAGGAVLKMAGSEYDPMSLYDPTTGLFTAPVAGYYHFSGTVRLNNVPTFSGYFRARFMKNGAHVEFIVGDAILGTFINGAAYASWNSSINLPLAQGDTVNLAMDWASGPTTVTLDNSGWSGFLIA